MARTRAPARPGGGAPPRGGPRTRAGERRWNCCCTRTSTSSTRSGRIGRTSLLACSIATEKRSTDRSRRTRPSRTSRGSGGPLRTPGRSSGRVQLEKHTPNASSPNGAPRRERRRSCSAPTVSSRSCRPPAGRTNRMGRGSTGCTTGPRSGSSPRIRPSPRRTCTRRSCAERSTPFVECWPRRQTPRGRREARDSLSCLHTLHASEDDRQRTRHRAAAARRGRKSERFLHGRRRAVQRPRWGGG